MEVSVSLGLIYCGTTLAASRRTESCLVDLRTLVQRALDRLEPRDQKKSNPSEGGPEIKATRIASITGGKGVAAMPVS
jgi:hypothetical protein